MIEINQPKFHKWQKVFCGTSPKVRTITESIYLADRDEWVYKVTTGNRLSNGQHETCTVSEKDICVDVNVLVDKMQVELVQLQVEAEHAILKYRNAVKSYVEKFPELSPEETKEVHQSQQAK